jgi:hypothetical protein
MAAARLAGYTVMGAPVDITMHFIDLVPAWGLFILTSLVVLAASECGFRLAQAEQKHENEAVSGAVVQSTIALVAFLLAFTFGFAAERFNERRLLVIEEANAIGTTYLRADFLPEANREKVKDILRQYVDLRVLAVQDPKNISEALKQTKQMHAKLWEQTVAAGRQDLDSDIVALFIEALNDTINLHTQRVATGIYVRIPDFVWLTLYVMIVLGMGSIGYQCGVNNSKNRIVTIALAVSFSIVTTMIADLDNPTTGFLKTSQQPLIDLKETITGARQ